MKLTKIMTFISDAKTITALHNITSCSFVGQSTEICQWLTAWLPLKELLELLILVSFYGIVTIDLCLYLQYAGCDRSVNQSKHLYSAISRKRIRGAGDVSLIMVCLFVLCCTAKEINKWINVVSTRWQEFQLMWRAWWNVIVICWLWICPIARHVVRRQRGCRDGSVGEIMASCVQCCVSNRCTIHSVAISSSAVSSVGC